MLPIIKMANTRKLRKRIKKLRSKLARLSPEEFKASTFTGTWTGKDIAVNKSGPVKTMKTVRLRCDKAGVIKGTVSWVALSDFVGFNESQHAVTEHAEDVIGLVQQSTGTISLVEKHESGTFVGTVRKNGKIRLRQTQPGIQPVVSVMLLPKVSDKP